MLPWLRRCSEYASCLLTDGTGADDGLLNVAALLSTPVGPRRRR